MGRGQLSLLINISVALKHVTDAHLPRELPLRSYFCSNVRSLTPYLQQCEGKNIPSVGRNLGRTRSLETVATDPRSSKHWCGEYDGKGVGVASASRFDSKRHSDRSEWAEHLMRCSRRWADAGGGANSQPSVAYRFVQLAIWRVRWGLGCVFGARRCDLAYMRRRGGG